jgi:hypothetical protein
MLVALRAKNENFENSLFGKRAKKRLAFVLKSSKENGRL